MHINVHIAPFILIWSMGNLVALLWAAPLIVTTTANPEFPSHLNGNATEALDIIIANDYQEFCRLALANNAVVRRSPQSFSYSSSTSNGVTTTSYTSGDVFANTLTTSGNGVENIAAYSSDLTGSELATAEQAINPDFATSVTFPVELPASTSLLPSTPVLPVEQIAQPSVTLPAPNPEISTSVIPASISGAASSSSAPSPIVSSPRITYRLDGVVIPEDLTVFTPSAIKEACVLGIET